MFIKIIMNLNGILAFVAKFTIYNLFILNISSDI